MVAICQGSLAEQRLMLMLNRTPNNVGFATSTLTQAEIIRHI